MQRSWEWLKASCCSAESWLSKSYNRRSEGLPMSGDGEVWQVVLLMAAVVVVLMLLSLNGGGGSEGLLG